MRDIYAADVMESDVVTFTPSTPIADALRTFEGARISGAPVVDGNGKIIGMLSAADVARPAHLRRGRIDGKKAADCVTAPLDDAELLVLARKELESTSERPTVGDWMSTGILCAAPEW